MKKLTTAGLFLIILIFSGASTGHAQSSKAEDMFKNHINKVVQKVKQAESPKQKRALLNSSFDKLIRGLNKVENMQTLSGENLMALGQFRQNITEKKNELNGFGGFEQIPDTQLNNFADYIQQDFEQADSEQLLGIAIIVTFAVFLWVMLFT